LVFRQESPTSVQAGHTMERDNHASIMTRSAPSRTSMGPPKNLDASVAFYESAKRLSPYERTFGVILARPTIWRWANATDALSAFKRCAPALSLTRRRSLEIRQFLHFGLTGIPEALAALRCTRRKHPAHRNVFRLAVSATRDIVRFCRCFSPGVGIL